MRALANEYPVDPIAEAERYVENAHDLLKNKGKLDIDTQYYTDRKYVRMAGNTLWNGMLLILDAVFDVKAHDDSRADIKDYRMAVGSRDKKLLSHINAGYDIMHLSMGYDGNGYKPMCMEGFRIANEIIDRCRNLL